MTCVMTAMLDRSLFVLMLSHVMVMKGVTGSVITLTTTPTVIKPLLTKHLSVMCTLEDNQAGGGLVGKRDGVTNPLYSVTQTSTNIARLISLVVLRDGQDIASVTPFSQAKAEGRQDHVNVTGEVATGHGHLLLNYTYPGLAEAGNLTCEANGIDANGHTTKFVTSLVLDVQEPSVSDLTKEMITMQTTIASLETAVTAYQTQLSHHTSLLTTATSQISALQHDLADVRHVETGFLDCGPSSNWVTDNSGMHYTKHKHLSHKFKTSYTSPPVVFLSLRYVFVKEGKNTLYGFTLANVTSSGFDMFCETSVGSYGYDLRDLEVSWLSVGAA